MKQVILIGGPSHGEIMEMEDDMTDYRKIYAQGPSGYQEHRYHDVGEDIFLHSSMQEVHMIPISKLKVDSKQIDVKTLTVNPVTIFKTLTYKSQIIAFVKVSFDPMCKRVFINTSMFIDTSMFT